LTTFSIGYGLDDWDSIPGSGNDGFFAIMSRLALGPTQTTI